MAREALSEKQMESFLRFVHDDYIYCKYYEVMYILFHTGLRISEFCCGLTDKDIDLENKIIDVNKQLHRHSDMTYSINPTKTMHEPGSCQSLMMWLICSGPFAG